MIQTPQLYGSYIDICMPPCKTLEATNSCYSEAKVYTLGGTKSWEQCKKKTKNTMIF